MTEFEQLLAVGFANAKLQMPATVIVDGHSYVGVSSPVQTSELLQKQGFLTESDGMVVLSVADATAASITDGTEMLVDGFTVRVFRIDKTATDPTREIHFKHIR